MSFILHEDLVPMFFNKASEDKLIAKAYALKHIYIGVYKKGIYASKRLILRTFFFSVGRKAQAA
jgi:hypothetical protein